MKPEVTVRPCTIEEIELAGTFASLMNDYARESSNPALGAATPAMPTYRLMESTGGLIAIGAFAPNLIGIAIVLIYGVPHYASRLIAAMESFFVDPSMRHTGAGMKLLKAAEVAAKERGAMCLLVSAPVGGRLSQVLPRLPGYSKTNEVFTKCL